jgi:hypothetical protein
MQTPPPAPAPAPAKAPASEGQHTPIRHLNRLHKSAAKGPANPFRNPLAPSGSMSVGGMRKASSVLPLASLKGLAPLAKNVAAAVALQAAQGAKATTAPGPSGMPSSDLLMEQLDQFVLTAKKAAPAATAVAVATSAPSTPVAVPVARAPGSAGPYSSTSPTKRVGAAGIPYATMACMGLSKSASKPLKSTLSLLPARGMGARRATLNGAGIPAPRAAMPPQSKDVSRLLHIDSSRKHTLRRANSDLSASPVPSASPTVSKVTFGPPVRLEAARGVDCI